MPELIFVAGCNAAGKSTFIRTKLSSLEGYEVFMTDVYKSRTKELVSIALKSGKNIILETVFNDASFRELVDLANTLGYETSLIVLFLDSMEQSFKRVGLRAIAQTGLLISEGNVKLNFNESFKNVSEYFLYFNRTQFIYTGVDTVNQNIVSFQHATLDKYISNNLNYIQNFAKYGLSRGRLDQVEYDVITRNKDYNMNS
ncbi:hypothetical protein EZ449_13565 [Pedobacter frigidisoli]|uniref:UDP-N-acetylglucosamine kinase n=1 Tax=Pedobacter frigidisoli TaxID=2530455 RepID=A0A4R0P2F4_9SPHI|nr:hypothetical protein [Pedobacter frigidisoli]TCD07568.1 hypothetical protein EZ449_13565 [Pedobacter frigidisoli]